MNSFKNGKEGQNDLLNSLPRLLWLRLPSSRVLRLLRAPLQPLFILQRGQLLLDGLHCLN